MARADDNRIEELEQNGQEDRESQGYDEPGAHELPVRVHLLVGWRGSVQHRDPRAVLGGLEALGELGLLDLAAEPQVAFGDEAIDVENGEAEWFESLLSLDEHKVAHQQFSAAERNVKKGLTRMGFYDGKPHTIRAGPFLITIAPSEGEAKEINFVREPSTRTTIKREG